MRALVALVGLFLLPLASAGGFTCAFDVEGEIDVSVGDKTYYLWDAKCDLPCVSLWVYEETNGVAGLQIEDWYVDETVCYPRSIAADTIIV